MLVIDIKTKEQFDEISKYLINHNLRAFEIDNEELIDYFLGKEMENIDITQIANRDEVLEYLVQNI